MNLYYGIFKKMDSIRSKFLKIYFIFWNFKIFVTFQKDERFVQEIDKDQRWIFKKEIKKNEKDGKTNHEEITRKDRRK